MELNVALSYKTMYKTQFKYTVDGLTVEHCLKQLSENKTE